VATPAVASAVVAIPVSLLVADAYDVNVGVVGDNIKTSEGANVISIVMSPIEATIYDTGRCITT
jgi:hypothetical protein